MEKFSENIEKRSKLKKQMDKLRKENLKSIMRYYEHLKKVGKIKEERFVRCWQIVEPPFVPNDGHMYVHVQYGIRGDVRIKNDTIKVDDIDNFLNDN